MSSLEDRRTAQGAAALPPSTVPAQTDVDAAPSPNARQRDLQRMEAQGAAAMRPLLMLGGALEGPRLPRIVRAAQLFLITVACVAPVLLFLRVAF